MANKPQETGKAEDAITALREAEERSAKTIEAAKAARDERVKRAKELADATVFKAKGEAEALKSRMLAEARAKIEKEEKGTLADGERQAAEAKKKAPPARLPAEICMKILEEYNV